MDFDIHLRSWNESPWILRDDHTLILEDEHRPDAERTYLWSHFPGNILRQGFVFLRLTGDFLWK